MQQNYEYGYTSSEELRGMVHSNKGQLMSGYTIGILVQDVHYPLIPGNVVNACSYNYPVRMEIVPGANQDRVHSADSSLLPRIIKTCELLVSQGVRAIVGGCGYFGNFQKEVADAIDVPVYLSSIIQIPWIRAGLGNDDEIGIICADKKSFTDDILSQCLVGESDKKRCHIVGAQDMPEFSSLLNRRGSFDNSIIEKELVELATNLIDTHPKIKALLLECSDMPPYSAVIQRAVRLPVYDFMTLIDFVHSAVAKHPYYGFI